LRRRLKQPAHDFITAMPEGYDTVIGERGVGLSGGQKQRISIARALLKNPAILVLDDATSAVDMETEYQIQKSLEKLMNGRTTFIIAHRISSVRKADEILVLEDGAIAERGSHEELLQKKGIYYRIYREQYKDYELLQRKVI
jgi:ATP-binding cassette subfamily B multidrug efflux pump